jgi:hypothetical protein
MPENWQRIKEIAGEAMECKLEERQAFLDAACGQDEVLRAEVESLLAAHADSDNLSQNPWGSTLAEAPSESSSVGPYISWCGSWASVGWGRCGWRNKSFQFGDLLL